MLCARQSLYQPLRQAVDHTVNRQLLVGNRREWTNCQSANVRHLAG